MRRIVPCFALAVLGAANVLAESWIIDVPEPSPAAPTAKAAGPTSYGLRGIFDPGFNNILAYAFKVPDGWRVAQSFTREWNGTIPINKVYVGLSSPDGRDSIEFLPCMMYHYEDGPNAARLRQFSEQHGAHDPTSLPPMGPVEYLKKVYLPLLAAKGNFTPRLTGERVLPPTQADANTKNLFGYVEGTLPSGSKIYLDAQITASSRRGVGSMLYSMAVYPHLVQSSADLGAAISRADAINRAIAVNPAWQQQDQELTRRGVDESLRATMEQWRINRDAAEARRQAINHNYAMRRRASDQVVNAYCDYLGDRVLYENPDTGQRVKVQNGGRHAYQDRGGNVLTTDAPLDPNNVDWWELQEVEVKNY